MKVHKHFRFYSVVAGTAGAVGGVAQPDALCAGDLDDAKPFNNPAMERTLIATNGWGRG